jgi:hypothetical protein
MIDREMFEEWMAHPVTEHVMKRVGELAEQNKQQWIARSWDQGICNPTELIDLKARAEAAKDLSELKYEDISDEDGKPERSVSNRVQGADPAGRSDGQDR